MDGVSLAQWATYFAYAFVIVTYAVKVSKIARIPVHLRWELYPVIGEKGYRYGGSYYEELDWWTKRRHKSNIRGIIYLLKKYLFFGEYFRRNRGYWLGLYPWHIGFYLIVLFHVLCLAGALAAVLGGVSIAPLSASGPGRIIYYLTLVVAVAGFAAGSIGSIGMMVKRLTDEDLRDYTSPINYFNYVFFLVVFLSGLVAWYFFDRTLSVYRQFWQALVTFRYMAVEPAVYTHIILFALFLIYLPFTRSTHYITKLIAFFGVRWDDASVVRRLDMQKKIEKALDQPIGWSAAHIQSGKKWREAVASMPGDGTDTEIK